MVTIVGIGPGHKDYILPAALNKLKECHAVVGFERAVDVVDFCRCRKITVSSLKEILEICKGFEGDLCIVASGDPLFYGITNYIKKNLNEDISVVPGISSFQYLAAKLSIPWSGGVVSSMHGRDNSFIDDVKSTQYSFWLTGNKNKPEMLCNKLAEEKINCRVYIGERLSYDDEKISCGRPEELMDGEYSSLSVVLVERVIDTE